MGDLVEREMLWNATCKQIVGLLMRSAIRTNKSSLIFANPDVNMALEWPQLQFKRLQIKSPRIPI